MITSDELRTLFLFERLSDERLEWLAERGRVVEHAAGSTVFVQGDPATCFYVLLSGTLSTSTRVTGGELETIRTDHRGSYSGALLAYVGDRVPQVYGTTLRCVTDCRFFELSAEDFGHAVSEWFPMATHLLEGATVQGRAVQHTIADHERLAALGSVTAGLTHELNNPAAAAIRATASMRERLADLRASLRERDIADLVDQVLQKPRTALSPLDAADLEGTIEDWLDDHDVSDGWKLAPSLAAAGMDADCLDQLASAVQEEDLGHALSLTTTMLDTHNLLDEVSEATRRISDLVTAAKQYSQMDRAPLQTVDVHEGLESTLTLLGRKLTGLEIVRDYARDLPAIGAYAGELNQVWTNLIDNAACAMEGTGTLTIRTFREDGNVVVEVGDTGPGVPEEIRSRIFEPFFTTKPVGQGTGLGLDISWRIVTGRMGGDLRVESSPEGARFQVRLPLS